MATEEAALATLLAAIAVRPAHAKLLEDLVAWAEDGCEDDTEPNVDDYEGVTFALGVELVLDVRAIYLRDRPIHPLGYPVAVAAAALRPRRKPETMYDMMRLRGLV